MDKISKFKKNTTIERNAILKIMTPKEAIQLCDIYCNTITTKAALITKYKIESKNFHGIIYQIGIKGDKISIQGKLTSQEEKRLWIFNQVR